MGVALRLRFRPEQLGRRDGIRCQRATFATHGRVRREWPGAICDLVYRQSEGDCQKAADTRKDDLSWDFPKNRRHPLNNRRFSQSGPTAPCAILISANAPFSTAADLNKTYSCASGRPGQPIHKYKNCRETMTLSCDSRLSWARRGGLVKQQHADAAGDQRVIEKLPFADQEPCDQAAGNIGPVVAAEDAEK